MFTVLKIALRWIMDWLYFVSLICLAGASVGVVTHFLFAVCFVDSPDFGYYASLGFLHGLKYGSVWAGGVAIVLCVIRAHNEYIQNKARRVS